MEFIPNKASFGEACTVQPENITSTFPSKSPTSVAVIIPVHNGGAAFRTCLEHIAALDPPPAEFIVVADGDTDGSPELARQSGATVLTNAHAQGPAQARNCGAHYASSDLLFFVDADVALPSDALQHLHQAWQAQPALAALIGSYDDTPSDPRFLSQYRNLLHHYTHQVAQEDAFTFWGACGAIQRTIFLELNGFDERYRLPSIEDIELGLRLKQAGYAIQLRKALQVKHLKRWTAYSLLKTDIFQRALPWSRLILQSKHIVSDLNLSWVNRLSAVMVGAFVVGLPFSFFWPLVMIGTGLLALSVFIANAPLYHFFLQRRDLAFVLAAIPWHWLYYLYSLLAFAAVVTHFRFEQLRKLFVLSSRRLFSQQVQ